MDTLLYAGLANAVVATVLAVAVASVTRFWRRPALAHALWLLVLLKLITPPFLVIGLPWTPPVEVAPERGPVAWAGGQMAQLPEPAGWPASASRLSASDSGVAPSEDPALADHPMPATGSAPAARAGFSLRATIAGVWLTGSLLWWTLAGWRIAHFRQLLRHAEPARAGVQEQAQLLAGRLGLPTCPRILLLRARIAPLLWALGRTPYLLLPAGLWDRLTPDQRDTLLAHELAHLRRRDHWVRRLELVVLGLYWWHPIAWWARHELQEAEEQCCDAWVVWALPAAAPAYAAALVETVAFLSQIRRPVPLAASGVGQVQTLKRRLTMILRQPAPRALSGAGVLAVVGVGALLLPLLPTWAEPPTADPPAQRRVQTDPTQPMPGAALDQPLHFTVKPQTRTVTTFEFAAQDPKAASPSQPKVPSPAERERADRLQEIRDEVALLEAQLQVKQAQLRAAQVGLRLATEQLRRFTELRDKGALSEGTYTKAKDDVASLQAQLQVKEAELREPQLRLEQARRRLANLQGHAAPVQPAQKKKTAQPNADANRLQELEKKLDRLLDEVESLRKQIPPPARPKGGRVAQPHGPALSFSENRVVDLAFTTDPKLRDQIRQVILYVSADEGRTWKQGATAAPDAKVLTFTAPADGLYWFNVATMDRAGNQEPADVTKMPPACKIQVGAHRVGN